MKLQLKPGITKTVKAIVVLLILILGLTTAIYLASLDDRVTLLETKPIKAERVEVVVTPTVQVTASPSAQPTKRVVTVAPTIPGGK